MEKITLFEIVPVGILANIYRNYSHYDQEQLYRSQEQGMDFIFSRYKDIRHLLAMELVTSK